MSKKRKNPSKTRIGSFLPSSEERDEALEESSEFFGSFESLFDEDEDEDEDEWKISRILYNGLLFLMKFNFTFR